MPRTLLGVQRHTDIQFLLWNSEKHEQPGKSQLGTRKLNHNQPSN